MHVSEPLVDAQPCLVSMDDGRASELLLDLQLSLDQPGGTLPDDVGDRPGRDAAAEELTHGLTSAPIGQQLILLEVEHTGLEPPPHTARPSGHCPRTLLALCARTPGSA